MDKYIVMTHGRKGIFLFLVNRKITKNNWWTCSTVDAIQFNSIEAARNQANKLHYKSPTVITLNEAISLEKRNEMNIDYESMEHPFSSEALGQE